MTILSSTCPATGTVLWQGEAADAAAVAATVARARAALAGWSRTPLEDRIAVARAYAERLKAAGEDMARTIAQETGKPLWETRQEVGSMVGKVELSIRAQAERAGTRTDPSPFGSAVLRHKPHGVMAVLGPYNFPGHLPNGHIVPALLAGNTVVFKPSEETPMTGEAMVRLWHEAGLPAHVLQVVQGARETGAALVDADIDGLLFTGSATTGAFLRRALVDRPHVILALELGGNNPLIAWDGEPEAVAGIIAASAYATTGQRCSCARRLIVPAGPDGDRMIEAVAALADRMTIGAWDADPQPTLGSLISARAAANAHAAYQALVAGGGRVIRPLTGVEGRSEAFVTPAVVDVTGLTVSDTEIFAPVLQVRRAGSWDEAMALANATAFGLSAGLLSEDPARWEDFVLRSRAGVVNWNRPTTGASGAMPFGGLGSSGNHRPSAYYAADYCAYPVASFESPALADLTGDLVGLEPAR
ncbi:succinylglutamate-semialdehyde dehydrogenase [Novosphingobium sp. KCTC 2891]|uniref:succinylglutamate-semialdehyde dehydrogenase n=1 Tax=Novosphingobium sp. KCTC 2891 TaxID=2989730 RepID=UPI0022239890|nr:succinylglutamate-semialdehyde dehydrogenase [Novosphingobium sp. KCTC 2891]MCW1382435.1 succinylglutamate-semialdehyde dehydrogenase [Novosphingobium sp. KCTC 2891]